VKARKSAPPFRGIKIISGGQTGADRAALDWAILHRIPHGGWCPRGRLAEDGPIARRYRLRETPAADYATRTEWNVRDADATVIFSIAKKLSGGSRLTAELARQHRKPLLQLCRDGPRGDPAKRLLAFLQRHEINTLNVAGPRASEEPAFCRFVRDTLERVFTSPPPSSESSAPAAQPAAISAEHAIPSPLKASRIRIRKSGTQELGSGKLKPSGKISPQIKGFQDNQFIRH